MITHDIIAAGHFYILEYVKLFVRNMLGSAVFFAILELISLGWEKYKSK